MKYIVLNQITLLEALQLLAPESSKTTLRSWLKEERVLVDGRVETNGNSVLQKDQQVALGARKRFLPGGLSLLYEDSHLVVVEKPSGLLTVSTAFEKNETVHAILKRNYYPRQVHVVHRLDQETSGVLVFALSEVARDKMKEIFEEHDIERSYTAIVEGKIEKEQGTWEAYLVQDRNYHVHVTKDPSEGRLSITHYKREALTKRYSLLTLRLETGRKHQIRVHCAANGHPVLGDNKYGQLKSPIQRMCLHAHHLGFEHPITGKKMKFHSEIPFEFYQLVRK